MAITPQDFDFNQLLARSLPSGDPLIDQLRAGSAVAGRSPVPRISPPTAGIFARRPADPGPYPVASPYMLPKPNLFGVEPPGVGEQDLPAPFPTPDLYGMTEEQLGRQREWGDKIASFIPSFTPSFAAQGIRALARKAELGAVDEFRRRESQDIQGGGLVDPVVPAGSVADSITWNPRNWQQPPQQPPHALDAIATHMGYRNIPDYGFIEVDTTDADDGEFQGDVGGGFEEGGIEEGGFEASRDFYDF